MGDQPMQCKIQLVVVSDHGQKESVTEIAVLEKNDHRVEHLGLTLAESKEILKELQKHIVQEQAASFLDRSRSCPDCGTPLKTKGHHSVTFRTLFGNIALDSPRLRHCRCQPRATQTF